MLITDAAQNAMSANYNSVAYGAVLVATIIGTSFTLDWLGYRFEPVRRFIQANTRPLVRNGKLNSKQLGHEMISESELTSQLRLQGVERLEEVRAAYLEGPARSARHKGGAG